MTFSDQTLRMIIAPHFGGETVRLRFSNRFGDPEQDGDLPGDVTLDDVYVGLRSRGAELLEGSSRQVAFGGRNSVTLFNGSVALSDPVRMPIDPFQDVAVSFHVAGSAPLASDDSAHATSYLTPAGSGSHGADSDGTAFTETTGSWFGINAVDVQAKRPTGLVVALGDSITDGSGTTADANRR